jgi:hypothetical protein
MTFESGSHPPILLSITMLRPVHIRRVPRGGAPKGPPSQIGKHLARCYGFTENVHIPSLSESSLRLTTPGLTAGSGKSILRFVSSAELLPHRTNDRPAPRSFGISSPLSATGSAFMAYFFFDFKDTGKQDSRALLSSLLVQLSEQSGQCRDLLMQLYSAHQNGSRQPTDDSLARCLTDMLTTMRDVPIYLIMDALDECPNDSGIPSSRENVLELVKKLVELRRPNLRLFATSRPEFDIRTALEPLATQQLSLHDESGQKLDIDHYVSSVVRSDKRMKRWRDDEKAMVIQKLTEKADGM